MRHKIRDNGPGWMARVLYWPSVVRHRMGPRRALTKLHVGCGTNHFAGWINADIDPRAELIVFLEKKLPFRDASLEYIYSEHVLEHVPYETGLAFLKEAHRALKPGGVIRLAVPNLEEIAAGYHLKDWKERLDWVKWPDYAFIQTRAQMINIAFRWWGHAHLYDQEELERVARTAGFTSVSFPAYWMSGHEELKGRETRLDSNLIIEAVK
ncbi:MAG TPA: methyltransferase domain-containing protein [Holophagaceae bacterium]|nr:methyltransferase domain-containing protein [Holophagaceae bacterium]